MKKIEIDVLISSISLMSMSIMVSLILSAIVKLSSDEDIQFLVDEMTTTPLRQQQALDKLTEYDDENLLCLLPYFSDERAVASDEVKFLNTSPVVGERYFLTSGKKVGQVLIQYFCWRTTQCTVDSASDIMEVRHQLEDTLRIQQTRAGSGRLRCTDESYKRE